MKAWDIIGYVYKADIYCPACTVNEVIKDNNLEHLTERESFKDDLAVIADIKGIDWEDEYSYDSDDFPKVMFASNVEGDVNCCKCHKPLTP